MCEHVTPHQWSHARSHDGACRSVNTVFTNHRIVVSVTNHGKSRPRFPCTNQAGYATTAYSESQRCTEFLGYYVEEE